MYYDSEEDTDTVYLFLADDNANEKLKNHLDKATNPKSDKPMKLPDGLTVIPTFRRYLSQFNFQLNCSK